jgi:cardiolipin synthase
MRLVSASHVERRELALAFDDSAANASAVHVGGSTFFPLQLEDIEGATSSIHVVQFGFKPGKIGDAFVAALAAKAKAGVPVRIVVDTNGSAPEGSSRALYQRLIDAGAQVCTTRGTKARAPFGPLGTDGRPTRWNLESLGHVDHRKFFVIDGRIGWVGGAGIEDHFEDGRFHDLFVRVEGPVVSQLQLVFLASFRWLGGTAPPDDVPPLFPEHEQGEGAAPAIVLHNAPGPFRPITDAIAASLDSATTTLDVINPYVTDGGMIQRIERAAERGVAVRLFVPGAPNNWACGLAQRHHHQRLLEAGVQIFDHPQMLHAKAFVRDGEEVLAGTCNLEAWSLKRFFEIDILVRSPALARQFDERFSQPALQVSAPGSAPTGVVDRAKSATLAALSPLL